MNAYEIGYMVGLQKVAAHLSMPSPSAGLGRNMRLATPSKAPSSIKAIQGRPGKPGAVTPAFKVKNTPADLAKNEAISADVDKVYSTPQIRAQGNPL